MASPAVVVVVLLSLLHHAISQYGVVAPNGMITVVTDGGSGPIYAQMPAAELPPAEVIVEEEPVIEIPAEEVATRMFFRTNGNGGGYAVVAPPPPPPMTPAPLSNGYGAATPSNGARNRQFFRSNGNGNGHRYASAAPPANGGRRNVFFRSNGNGYGSAAAAPATSNGARRQLFFRSNANGNGYATTAAPAPAAPASNGYGTAATSNGARSLGFFRSSNGYAAQAAPADARRSRGFFRSNGNGQSGSYGAAAPTPAPAQVSNGYGQQSVTPAMAPSSFIPTELAEGVSIPQIPGVAGVDYPILSQALVTSFHCEDKPAPGYYADIESKCQVFYVCQQNVDRFTFLCPNGTMFNEKYSVCDWWYNVRCESSPAAGNGYAKPAPQMNGYARPPPPPPTTTTTAAPVQHSYYSQPAVTEVDPTVAEVANGDLVISEPVEDVVVDANGDALRMLNFRFNRLRPRVASRFRSNLRSNGGGYQTPVTVVEEVSQDVIVAEDVSLENGGSSQNGQVANGNGYKKGGNGGRRMKSFLRSNRHRFNRLRNEGNGAEVQYGVPSSIQNGYGGAPANGNGGLTTSAPANGNGGATSAAPTNGLLTTVAPSDVTEGDVTVVSIDTTTGQEEAVLTTESSEAQVSGEEPVIVMLNGNGDAPVNGNGQVSANGNGAAAAPTTNGNGAAAPTNGVVAIVNGNGGTALYGTRLRSMVRSLVRPRKMFRSGMLRMATPELAGTRYDPTMTAVNGNGQQADTIVQANGEPVFFRRARF